jgi:hypothetical protein
MDRIWELVQAELIWWKQDLIILYCLLVLFSIGYDYYCYKKRIDGNRFKIWWVWLIAVWAFPLLILWFWYSAKKKI